MAKAAFVLTETTSGKAKNVANLIKHLDGVRVVNVVSESYGVIALVESDDSDGIREIASKIALTSGVLRCVVCSERELDSSAAPSGFARMDDGYCWSAREPSF